MTVCSVNTAFLIPGPIAVNISEVELDRVEAENSHLTLGGSWSPSDCKPWQLVAILIPYRDRWEHLQLLLYRLHPMLQKQRISYQIFVIEQVIIISCSIIM